MVDSPTEQVALNLEETGWILQSLVRDLNPYLMGDRIPSNVREIDAVQRGIRLYNRIDEVNARLLRKPATPLPEIAHVDGDHHHAS